jgi:hypothetical protein
MKQDSCECAGHGRKCEALRGLYEFEKMMFKEDPLTVHVRERK